MAVDRDKLALYVMGELDDRDAASVERQVAADPEWAEALRREASLEVGMFEVAAQARPAASVVPTKAAAPAWWRTLLAPTIGVLAMAALALMVVGPVDAPPATWSLEVRGGEATMRSGDEASAVYTKGSSLWLLVRPSTRVEAPQDAYVTIDGSRVRVTLVPQDGGALLVEATFGHELPEMSAGEHLLQVHIPGVPVQSYPFLWKDAEGNTP